MECDCHGLDTLNWFANAHPVKALGQGGLRYPIYYGDVTSDHYDIIFTYPNGAEGYLLSARWTCGFRDVKEQFFGSKGVLETARTYYKLHGPVAASRLTNDDKLDDTSLIEKVPSKREITIDAVEAFFTSILEGKAEEHVAGCRDQHPRLPSWGVWPTSSSARSPGMKCCVPGELARRCRTLLGSAAAKTRLQLRCQFEEAGHEALGSSAGAVQPSGTAQR